MEVKILFELLVNVELLTLCVILDWLVSLVRFLLIELLLVELLVFNGRIFDEFDSELKLLEWSGKFKLVAEWIV